MIARDAFDWPQARCITVGGVRLAIYELGVGSPGRPVLIFCHGWPELAFSWRHQLTALAAAGWRCIALDMRGYGLSDCPLPVEAYDMQTLCADVIGVLDDAGESKAVFVGHDWGGLVVWDLARRFPDRTAGVIALCTPHRKRLPFEPIAGMRARWGEDFYIVYFQQPGPAEALFEADLDKTFRFLQRTGPQARAAAAAAPDTPFLATHLALARFDGSADAPTMLSPQERGVYVEAFSRTGFRGGLNWYRNFTRNWHQGADLPDTVACPSLMIMAEWDSALPPSATEGMEAIVPNLTRCIIAQAGHWVQQEAPDAVNHAMVDWLSRTYT